MEESDPVNGWPQRALSLRDMMMMMMKSRCRGTRIMPYTPVSCGTGQSFRGTRTMPYTPVSRGTGHSSRGTRTMPYAY